MKKILFASMICGLVGMASAEITPGWKYTSGCYIASVTQNLDTLHFTIRNPAAGDANVTFGLTKASTYYNSFASVVLAAKAGSLPISFQVARETSSPFGAKYLCEDGPGYCAVEVSAIKMLP